MDPKIDLLPQFRFPPLSRNSKRSKHPYRPFFTRFVPPKLGPQDIPSGRFSASPQKDKYFTRRRHSQLNPIQSSLTKQLKQALSYIQPPPKHSDLSTRDVLARSLSIGANKNNRGQNTDIPQFIQAIFIQEPSPYRKSLVSSQNSSVDTRTADKLLQDANKIIKNGLKRSTDKKNMNGQIEEYWENYISQQDVIRWDIFEESLLVFLESYMVTDTGSIRKCNWTQFFKNLYQELAVQEENFFIWPDCHICKPPKFQKKVVSKYKFVKFSLKGGFVQVLQRAFQDTPFYINSLRKKEVYEFADGTVFKGLWNGGKREGQGSLILASGDTFLGTFSRGYREDYGVFTGNGYSYKGDWKHDKFNGYGVINFPNNSVYQGLWSKGAMTKGILTWEGYRYEGELRQALFQGPGKLTHSNGEIHKGYWKEGQLFGIAKITKPDKTKYKGIYINGHLEGEGSVTTQKFTYEGEFKHSKPHGEGQIVYKTGKVYTGSFVQGVQHGEGIEQIQGEQYNGTFQNGKRTGKATIKYPNGIFYRGQVENGEIIGQGTFFYPVGHQYSRYEGCLQNSLFNGKGKLWFATGEFYQGEFLNNEIQGKGKLTRKNDSYVGNFWKGKFHGDGEWECGVAFYKGVWENGVPDGRAEVRDYIGETFSGMFAAGQPVGRHKLQLDFIETLTKCSL